MFEDTKGVIRCRKSKGRQYNGLKKNDISTKHYTENKRLSNTNPPKENLGVTQVLHKVTHFLFHSRYPSCYYCTNPVMNEISVDCDCDNRNISVIICDTAIS